MQEASRFLGSPLYKKLRVDFRHCINSYRSEKSSGTSGLKRAARAEWGLDKLEEDDEDAYREKLADLLEGKL